MTRIIGIDEAGRGPLAGPVAVGAVCAPSDFDFFGAFPKLNDSKKVTEKNREAIFEELAFHDVITYSVMFETPTYIDEAGITEGVRSALEKALFQVAPTYEDVHVLLDGSLHAPVRYSQKTIIRGDETEPAIMLASIAAKVLRDRYMNEIAALYPTYGFDRHKGYGTKVHINAIRTHGLSPLHRKSFCKAFA